jgi:hypothetical protein
VQTDDQASDAGGTDGVAAYPVIASVALKPLRPRRFRRRARDPEDIPGRPGTTLVAQFQDTYEIVPRGVAMTDRLLVDASALLLVSTAQRLVETTVVLPSADPYTAIEVRARFRCRVLDPIAVLDHGGLDIGPLLTEYLLRYPRMRMTCLSMSLTDRAHWYRFQQQVVAMLIAYGEIVPVPIPGLTAVLADVAVTIRPVEQPGLAVAPPAAGDWTTAADAEPEPADPIPLQGRSRSFRSHNYTWGNST